MRIAFYAPMKAPDDPVPSGDRHMARLVARALGAAGYDPWVASRLGTLDLGGDPVRERVVARASMAEVEGILAGLGTLSAQEQPAASDAFGRGRGPRRGHRRVFDRQRGRAQGRRRASRGRARPRPRASTSRARI